MVANAVICLIHQANYLLDQQIAALERAATPSSLLLLGWWSAGGGGGREIRLIGRIRRIGRIALRPPRTANLQEAHGFAHRPPGKAEWLAVLGLLGLP